MAFLNTRSRNTTITVSNPDGSNSLDVSDVLSSLVVTDEFFSESGIITTSGTLELYAYPLKALDEILDPRRNPERFARGMKIDVQVADSTGTLQTHPRSPLYILKRPIPAPKGNVERAVLSIKVGCYLSLLNYRTPPSDDSGVTRGNSTAIADVMSSLLNAVGGPTYSGSLAGSINYPIPRIRGTAVEMLGGFAIAQQRVIFARGTAITDMDVLTQLDTNTHDLKLISSRDDAVYEATEGSETPVEKVIVTTNKKELEPVTEPAPTTTNTYDPRTRQVVDTDFFFSTGVIRKTKELFAEMRNIFPDLETSSSLRSRSLEVTEDNYDTTDGQKLRRTTVTLSEPQGIVAPELFPGSFQLRDSQRKTTRYTYDAEVTLVIETTYEVAQVLTDASATTVNAFNLVTNKVETETWRKTGDRYQPSFSVQYVAPLLTEVQNTSPPAPPAGINSQPPAPNRLLDQYEEITEELIGEAVFTQNSTTQFDIERERQYRLPDGVASTQEQVDATAELLGRILQGRILGQKWVTDLEDYWFNNGYNPMLRVDWIETIIEKFTLAAGNNTGNSTLVIRQSIGAYIPSSGSLAVHNDDGGIDAIAYSSYTGATFTLSGTLASNYSAGNRVEIRLKTRYRYLSNGHTFAITPTQATWGAQGIYLKQIAKVLNSESVEQPIDADITETDTVEPIQPYVYVQPFKGRDVSIGTFEALPDDPTETFLSEFTGHAGASGRIFDPVLRGRAGASGQIFIVSNISAFSGHAGAVGNYFRVFRTNLSGEAGAVGTFTTDQQLALYSLPFTFDEVLWWAARRATLTGVDVTLVEDQRSGGRDGTPNASEPKLLETEINNKPALHWDTAGGQVTFTASPSSDSWSVIAVYKYETTPGGVFRVAPASGSGFFEITATEMRYEGSTGAVVSATLPTDPSTGFAIYEFYVNAGAVELLQNGATIGTGTSAGAWTIDRITDDGVGELTGKLADLIINHREITLSNQTTIRSTLASEYNIGISSGGTLLSVAQSNNTSHLWLAGTDYSVDGSNVATWTDQIASLDLVSPANRAPATIIDSGITVLETDRFLNNGSGQGQLLQASLSYSQPMQAIALLKWNEPFGSFFCGSVVSPLVSTLYIGSGNYFIADTRIETYVPSIPNNTSYAVVYFKVDGANGELKVGLSGLSTADSGTPKAIDGITLFARGDDSSECSVSLAAFAFNTSGNWTTANINAIANQMVADYSALSPDWSDVV
jgi:hypothetical protein